MRLGKRYKKIAVDYAKAAAAGEIVCGAEIAAAARRFLADMERPDFKLHTKEPDFVCGIIERLMVHKQGQALDGTPLTNTPLILQPWQVFIVYNIVGFYFKNTNERRYKDCRYA